MNSQTGRGGEGVEPCCPEQQDGEDGKGVGAEAIAKRPSGEAAEKGEGDQDPG